MHDLDRRVCAVAFGLVSYVAFLAVFLYTIAFLADVAVPRTVDAGGTDSTTTWAVLIDLALIGLFGLQHSVMARPGFKRHWTRLVPSSIERSTYVLAASALLALLYWQWRPIDKVVWNLRGIWGDSVWVLFVVGWSIVLASTFLIDHFELFGLRQVYSRFRVRPPIHATFRTPLAYRVVRHPLMVGFFIVFWAAPHMSVGRLLFAAVASAYILVGVRFEEADLSAQLPEYRAYMANTPRFLPQPAPSKDHRHSRHLEPERKYR